MAGDARDGLIRVVHLERMSAVMMLAGAVLSEAALLALIGTARHRDVLVVGPIAIALASVVLLPVGLRIPARLRRRYADAAPLEGVTETLEEHDAVRRLSVRRIAVVVAVLACWLMLIGLASQQVMPPVMLITLAVSQWARSRATAGWERENGAVLWQGVPSFLGRPEAPVFRVPYVSAETVP